MSTPATRLRLVIDTNVLVSALLSPGRVPDRALSVLRARGAVVLYDERLAHEYRSVLARPKFRSVDRAKSDALVSGLLEAGERVEVRASYEGPLRDADDRAFVEVALAGRAHAVVTGNVADYPEGLGFEVLAPALLLARYGEL